MSLADTGCTLVVGDVGARTSTLSATYRHAQVEQHLRGIAAAHVERRRVGGLEPRPRRANHVTTGRHVEELRLPRQVAHRFGQHRVAGELDELHVDAGDVDRPFEHGNCRDDAARFRRRRWLLLRWRLLTRRILANGPTRRGGTRAGPDDGQRERQHAALLRDPSPGRRHQ